MLRWTDWVLRHKLFVTVFWLAVFAAGGALSAKTSESLSFAYDLPGQPGYETNKEINQRFGPGGQLDPLVLAVRLPSGRSASDPAVQRQFSDAVNRVASSLPGTRVASYANTQDPAFVAADGRTTFALIYPPPVPGQQPYAPVLPALREAAAQTDVAGAPLVVTGIEAMRTPTGEVSRGVLLEAVLGGLGALVVLALVFSSLLAAVPLLIAAVSILGSFLALFGLTQIMDVSFVVQYLVALIGLGVAIDYGLLIVMRWREERANGAENVDAVRTAMRTAGHSVVFSGVTVAISLAALVVIPVPFLRSIGFGGLLIPLLSVAVATTLLPVVLAKAGPRLEWPRRAPRSPRSARWRRIAAVVVRRPLLSTVVSGAVLLALAAPVLGMQLGAPQLDSYPAADASGRAAQELLAAGVAPGAIRPIEVVTGDPQAAGDRLATVPGVAEVVAPEGQGWRAGDDVILQVWTADDPAAPAGEQTLARVRQAADEIPRTRVGGTAAQDEDFIGAVYEYVWLVIPLIVIVTMLLLARALRSVLLPVKALVLNVVSLAAAYGITVLIWQQGWLTEALFDLPPSGAITTWVPIAVFAFLFGLSMDYELFILARIRESYDQNGDTARSVVDGISYTGRLVTSGALILLLAFVALSTIPLVEVKILATALALGIVIDAVVVRAVLAPALVALIDRGNWWFPASLRRILRTGEQSRKQD